LFNRSCAAPGAAPSRVSIPASLPWRAALSRGAIASPWRF
jgi:hypothetical protein